jgi:hypothetical protein
VGRGVRRSGIRRLRFAQKPAGYYESTGAGAPGQAVAGLSVAWYTRLDGTKVVHLKYGVTKVTPAGAAEAPALVPPELRDQLLSAGGYPVFGSERLCIAFAALLYLQKQGADVSGAEKVLQEPGDLDAWKALADSAVDPEGGARRSGRRSGRDLSNFTRRGGTPCGGADRMGRYP